MAQCKYCGKEMLNNEGSCFPKIKIGGGIYDRIPCGKDNVKSKRCGDCGVKIGEIHHFGCDMELCPICGEQVLFHITKENLCYMGGVMTALVDEEGNEYPIDDGLD